MKACAFCAEEIQDAAVVCRFCNRDQRTGSAGAAPPPVSQTVGSMGTTNTNAVVALVCALFLPFIGGVVGLVLGGKARREISDSRGGQSGDGLALAAMILGGLQLAIFAIFFLSLCTAVASSTSY